jgi:hypothetical protein
MTFGAHLRALVQRPIASVLAYLQNRNTANRSTVFVTDPSDQYLNQLVCGV